MACAPNLNTYQLKICLKYLKPPIWRRILVPKDVTFQKLHTIIIKSMGWNDTHLHEFRLGSGTIIGVPSEDDDYMSLDGEKTIDEKTVKLSEILKSPKDKITYLYDFGDGWEHDILLEKILPTDSNVVYPVCIAGKRACPPEDCGGFSGYYDLIEIMSNPSHPEHSETKKWLIKIGISDFKPEKFDPRELNLH